MIPILYPANETAFTSEGIGPLSDVLSCYVEEERNGSYELELEYPVTGILFSEIKTGRVILAKADDSGYWQPFDIFCCRNDYFANFAVDFYHQLLHKISFCQSYSRFLPSTTVQNKFLQILQ